MPGKTISVDFETVANLTKSPARFEFLKIFGKYGKHNNLKSLCGIFEKETGYSENYATEIISKLKPLLKGVKERDFEVEYLKIPINTIAEYYDKLEIRTKKRK